jgi:hypothetical protein
MDNITYIDITEREITTTFAVIDRGNGEFTTLPKPDYEEQLKANEAKTI